MIGKPVVKGTRTPVERVIRHLAENPDLRDLLQAFPHLTVEDATACLAYAHAQLERQQNRPPTHRRSLCGVLPPRERAEAEDWARLEARASRSIGEQA